MSIGTTTAATALGGMSYNNAPDRGRQGGPASGQELKNAIQYVNKIKVRFEHDQETYKKFLAILNTYTKEQNQDDVRVLFVFIHHCSYDT